MVEPISGSKPVLGAMPTDNRAQERYDSQVEAPEQQAAAYEKLSTAQFQ